MGERPARLIKADALGDLMRRLLMAVGLPSESAAICAEVFLEADLKGHAIQGVDHIHSMLLSMRDGRSNPGGRPRIVCEKEASALVDGEGGPGQPALLFAADLAVKKTKKAGCCAVGVRNCYDVFMLGYYGERIAREGLVGIVMTTGTPLVHPYGGADRLIGTNPLVIAIPAPGKGPVLLDFATSALASGTIVEALAHGEELPEGVAVGPDGLPTRDPAAAAAGANSPLGGHKGYGLGLCVGLLAGPLVGAQVGRAAIDAGHVTRGGKRGYMMGRRGNLVVAIDPSAFGEPAAFLEAVGAHLEEVKNSTKAPGVEEIRIPGERGFAAKERREREGVPVYQAVWDEIVRLAGELKVPLPE